MPVNYVSPPCLRRRTRRRALGLLGAAALAAATLTTGSAVPAGAAVPAGPFTIDVADREAVRRFYYSVHQASEGVAIGWTGSVAGCNPGTVSAEFREATRTRINYFRAMAGVTSDIPFTDANNTMAQATALTMSAQRALDHFPPANWACWTRLGADGAAVSNPRARQRRTGGDRCADARRLPGRPPALDAQPTDAVDGLGKRSPHHRRRGRRGATDGRRSVAGAARPTRALGRLAAEGVRPLSDRLSPVELLDGRCRLHQRHGGDDARRCCGTGDDHHPGELRRPGDRLGRRASGGRQRRLAQADQRSAL